MSLCNLPIVCDTKEFKETLVLPTGGGVRSDPGSASESNRLLSQLCLLRLQRVQTPNVLSFLLLRTNKTARGPRQSEIALAAGLVLVSQSRLLGGPAPAYSYLRKQAEVNITQPGK